jgi:hypothetical protein
MRFVTILPGRGGAEVKTTFTQTAQPECGAPSGPLGAA